jgi:hypothetical protein
MVVAPLTQSQARSLIFEVMIQEHFQSHQLYMLAGPMPQG